MKRTAFSSIPLSIFISSSLLLSGGCGGKPVKEADLGPVEHELLPLVGQFEVHRYTLSNGLRLLVVEDDSSPTLSYQTWFKVGSRDEQPGRTGLAHLFEHMMFKETKNLKEGEFDRLLESAGAEGENAFTSRDYTAYVQELPKDKLDLIARLESERMVNLVVNQKAFKTETEVVQNERRFRNENSPEGTLYQALFETGFVRHPYRWPVIGYQKDLDSMSAADAVQFYRSYYSPNHAIIIVAGDVDPDQVLETVQHYYGKIPAQTTSTKPAPYEPAQLSAKHKVIRLPIKTEILMMGYHIPAIDHEDTAGLWMLQSLLTGGKSSRLYRALVNTGIATSVEAYAFDNKDPSLFYISANLQKGQKAAQAEAIILKEIRRLVQTPVSDTELEKARNNLSFEFYQNLSSNSSRSHFLGQYETITTGFEDGVAIYNKSLTTTVPEVQKLVDNYFQPKNRTVVTGVPK